MPAHILTSVSNLSRKVEKLLGESHICLHNRHGISGKTVLDDLRLVDGSHKSLVVKTYLPARPAICFISSGFRVRLFTPSNLRVSTNTILRMGRFSPMPMASVLTTTSVSLAEPAHLFTPGGGRQASVNNAAVDSLVLQVGCQGQH